MTKLIKLIVTASLLGVAAVNASAQFSRSAMTHCIESYAGFSAQTYNYTGDISTVTGLARGASGGFRYTCFSPNQFGVFLRISSENVRSYEDEFFGTVNKADGGKYLYRYNGGYDYSSNLNTFITMGFAYRWSHGRLGIIPHLGLGVSRYYVDYYEFERRSRDGNSGPEYFDFRRTYRGTAPEYLDLIDRSTYWNDAPSFILSGDLQATYHLGRFFYLYAEAGANWAAASFVSEYSVIQSRREHTPSNWVEAVAWADTKDNWVRDYDNSIHSASSFIPMPVFHVNVGFGFSFGRRPIR